MRIQRQKLNHLPPTIRLFPKINLTSSFPTPLPPPPQVVQGRWRMGVCGQSITVRLCCSFLLTLFPCSSMDPLHGLHFLQGISACSNMGSSMGCTVDTCSIVVSSTGFRGISAIVPEAPPPPPPFLALVLAGLFLTLFFPHSSLLCRGWN